MNSSVVKWKLALVAASAIWAAFMLYPTFFKTNVDWINKNKFRYGLDIQGGLHLVMGIDVKGVTEETLKRMASTLQTQLKEEKIEATSATVEADGQSLSIQLANAGDMPKLSQFLEKNYPILQTVSAVGDKAGYRVSDNYLNDLKKRTVDQAIETIRNRIDEFGVSEPSISAQGDDRILVQLPGIEDAAKAKELINKTARLEFMVVSEDKINAEIPKLLDEAEKAGNYKTSTVKYSEYVSRVNKDLGSKLPEKHKLLFGKSENAENMDIGKIPYLLDTSVHLGGELLKDASIAFGQYGEPEVTLSFNPDGARRFEEITGANVNRRLAIILDDVVYSAPNIQTKIAGGNARITLGGGRDRQKQMDEANLISMALRAGALPAKLEQLEERTVGPTLGADSIRKGMLAAGLSSIFVLVFMIWLYKGMGILANAALALNIALLLGVMAALDATLTLPGIAGIALTIGMAVDANIIINERIKEELRRGISVEGSIREGYARAFSAIFDSNLTTALTAAILFYYGTGPVRGFAVSLLAGMATTMFAMIFVTRAVLEFLYGKYKFQKLSI